VKLINFSLFTIHCSLSFAQEGESLKTGMRLITHLKIHISAKMTVNVTTNSIHEGT
jgi:hypothetical protein